MFELKGKYALVTGGARGIGLAIVTELLKNEAKGVSIVDINETDGLRVTEDLKKQYGNRRVIFIKTDIACAEEFKRAFEETVSAFKNLDIVVNNAGIVNEIDWEKTIDLNFKATVRGTYLALKEYLPKYKQSNEGVILNISSISALDGIEGLAVYGASKAAILYMGRSLGTPETYKRTNTRVLTICPGATATNITVVYPKELPQKVRSDNEKNNKGVYQSAENVGKTVVKAIRERNTGSLIVVEESVEPYEVTFPTRQELKKK